jgi:hypothetical protein
MINISFLPFSRMEKINVDKVKKCVVKYLNKYVSVSICVDIWLTISNKYLH